MIAICVQLNEGALLCCLACLRFLLLSGPVLVLLYQLLILHEPLQLLVQRGQLRGTLLLHLLELRKEKEDERWSRASEQERE